MEVRGGGSYISQNDLRVHFGLGEAAKVDRLEVRWPNGLEEAWVDVSVDRFITLEEGSGRPLDGSGNQFGNADDPDGENMFQHQNRHMNNFSGNQDQGSGNGYGPGDGNGNDGDGPGDGSGNGPGGDCDGDGPSRP